MSEIIDEENLVNDLEQIEQHFTSAGKQNVLTQDINEIPRTYEQSASNKLSLFSLYLTFRGRSPA